MNPNPLPPPAEYRFKPGNAGGSAPRGKRITTWMAEFGEQPPAKWPKKNSDAFERLPGNAQIALRRLWGANKDDALGLKNAQYVEPRGIGEEDATGFPSAVYSIAAAILALKASGVQVRRPAEAVELVEKQKLEIAPEPEEDEPRQEKRFRRGRSG